MFLAIEVGGTKLQLGVGTGNGGPLADLRRATVEPAAGATGILEQIREIGACLIREHGIQAAESSNRWVGSVPSRFVDQV